MFDNNSLTCADLTNSKRLTLCRELLKTKYWRLIHKRQSPVLGWLVLTLDYHKKSLVDLTHEEWNELTIIFPNLINILKIVCQAEKVYITHFAEKPGYEHVHWHIIPISKSHLKQYRGPKIFSMLENKSLILPTEEIIPLCEKLFHSCQTIIDDFIS